MDWTLGEKMRLDELEIESRRRVYNWLVELTRWWLIFSDGVLRTLWIDA